MNYFGKDSMIIRLKSYDRVHRMHLKCEWFCVPFCLRGRKNREYYTKRKERTMGTISGTIYNINQKGNETDYPYIYKWGCAVCAAGAVASYYAKKQYEISDCETAGLINSDGYSCTWSWNVNAATSVQIGSTYTSASSVSLSAIRDEVDNNNPPILCFTYSGGTRGSGTHWVMVYGYEGSGTSFSQILVSDPADGTTKTLASAISYSGGTGATGTLSSVKTTAKKTRT